MWLTRVAINRRVTIIMVMVGLFVLGLTSLSRMPWDQFPKIDFPFIFITLPYPGAGPEEVEQGVVRPVEDAVSVISGVQTVESNCQESAGSVSIQFAYGTDLNAASADVRDALDRAKISFPEGAENPQLFKLDVGALPVLIVGFTGERSPRELYEMIDERVTPRLGQIPGVGAVSVTGGQEREIQIRVDRERLDAVGLSLGGLAQQLAAANLQLPAGSIKTGMRDYTVRVMGELQSMDEIRDLQLRTPTGLVSLSSVAEVLDTAAEASTLSRINGNPAVTVQILKQSEANTVLVCDQAKAEIERLVGTDGRPGLLPSDIKATIARDGSETVRESIRDVAEALILGAILASITIFLFLHNLRATIIIALTIPIAIITTFLPLGIGLAFTLNMMVLLGFSVAVGILVDDAIVVLENIQRHLDMGEQPAAAAFNGRTEIGSAAIAITMVDVVVFIPIALMGGIVGQFFYAFGWTVAICALVSLFISFTLTPSLAAWWFRREETLETERRGLLNVAVGRFYDAWDNGFAAFVRVYKVLLRAAVSHPYIAVVTAYSALFAVVLLVFPQLGFGMFPATDSGMINVELESSPGTRLEFTDRMVHTIEQRLLDHERYPEIEDISATVGSLGGFLGSGGRGGQYANLFITLEGRRARHRAGERSDQDLSEDLRRDLADIPGAGLRIFTVQGMGGGATEAPIQLELLTNDLAKANRLAQQIRRQMAEVPGLLYTDTSSKPGRPEVRVEVDRRRLAEVGLTIAEVAQNLRAAFTGSTITKYREDGSEYDLRVEIAEADKQEVPDVESMVVGLSPAGQVVRVRDIARLEMGEGPSQVQRVNRQRKVTVTAHLDPELTSMGLAERAVEEIVKTTDLEDVIWQWGGEVEQRRESFGFMGQALLLAIILVYVVVAMLYNSLLEPFNVMFNLPVAIVGAGLGLLIAGMEITIISLLGMIMLMGIVGKNSILIVDYTNTLRRRGLNRTEALMAAGPTRMKPVWMTTLTAVMALVPTALAVSEGSEFRAPLAVAVIFGLLLATLVSLVLVPATYVIWDEVANLFNRVARRCFRRGRSCEEPSLSGGDGSDGVVGDTD